MYCGTTLTTAGGAGMDGLRGAYCLLRLAMQLLRLLAVLFCQAAVLTFAPQASLSSSSPAHSQLDWAPSPPTSLVKHIPADDSRQKCQPNLSRQTSAWAGSGRLMAAVTAHCHSQSVVDLATQLVCQSPLIHLSAACSMCSQVVHCTSDLCQPDLAWAKHSQGWGCAANNCPQPHV